MSPAPPIPNYTPRMANLVVMQDGRAFRLDRVKCWGTDHTGTLLIELGDDTRFAVHQYDTPPARRVELLLLSVFGPRATYFPGEGEVS